MLLKGGNKTKEKRRNELAEIRAGWFVSVRLQEVRAKDKRDLEKTGVGFDVGRKSSPWLPHGDLEKPATYVESM